MENLFLNIFELRYLQKHKLSLEKEYNVKIHLPETDENSMCPSDVVFASIHGEEKSIENIKDLVKEGSAAESVVTLSDDSFEGGEKLRPGEGAPHEEIPAPLMLHELPVVFLKGQKNRNRNRKLRRLLAKARDIEQNMNSSSGDVHPRRRRRLRLRARTKSSRVALGSEETPLIPKKEGEKMHCIALDDSIILMEEGECAAPAEDSIILLGEKVKEEPLSGCETTGNDDVIVVEEVEPAIPRILRPIVIDGTNVAMDHGDNKTFSCRGIQLCVEHFVRLGHTQVTAFVPNFRRHCTQGRCPTTDPHILEEMESQQRVAFTPSRRVEGRALVCQDHRFIVELAAATEGVIVSNNDYRNLAGESEAFRRATQERLLMYCFVKDTLMIPRDPLGRDGPTLEEFLSRPATLPF